MEFSSLQFISDTLYMPLYKQRWCQLTANERCAAIRLVWPSN